MTRSAKTELRQRAKAQRAAVRDKQRLGPQTWDRLRRAGILAGASKVAAYVAVRDELETRPFLDERFDRKRGVVLPRVDGEDLQLWRVESWNEIEAGHFGILEPTAQLPKERLVVPSTVDLIVVPGLAFDERGGRLGYGKGHYDRLLPLLRPEVPRIGLCFEEQIVEEVPMEDHDVPMTHLATPERVVECQSG